MKHINVHIYKSVFFDGNTVFTTKNADTTGSGNQPTLRGVAMEIKGIHDSLRPTEQVSVDFKPFHDMECPGGLQPHLCKELTEGEQSEFWGEFKELYK